MKLFNKLPDSLNGLLVVMGVLAPLLMLGMATNPGMIALWTSLYIGIGALAGLGMFIFEKRNRSKADDFAKSVETNAASAEGVKDPQKIAQMDHMRKEFQRGIDIYKKHGKSLYSLPWYVVVGESESGKTEMLRRSEIGFPDKLQDRWQGSGGTLSMHWWFTNKAVILDTAGRLFVSEGADAGQNQWTNFLQMLKKNRPDCPINGLMLVIPSNRLLTHPNPEIEGARMAELDRNAGQIAKQMETLQTELGVRFPVYILITKMDKLNGFREFFGKIDKPEERYQMLGWSNPAPLGSPFDPQSVAEYMRSVADRLNRRMMSDLRNVAPDNPEGMRIDEVDALYAFPTAFESMSGKLTRYLRHIFTTDEWSAKPPFLRGIYFTSALQQGMVLDEALAAAMGVPLEKMDASGEDDGLSLSRNRTYFVRDLFLDKIFSEKGLVTTAGKIKSAISGWKLWVPALIVLALAAFGILGYFAKDDNGESEKWTALFESHGGQAGATVKQISKCTRSEDAAGFLTTLKSLGGDVQKAPRFRWIFKPAQKFDKELNTLREANYARVVAETLGMFEKDMISKLSDRVAKEGAESLRSADWEALHALVLLRYADPDHWDASSRSVSLADATGSAQPLGTLLGSLFSRIDLRGDGGNPLDLGNSLADAVFHARSLPGGTFKKKLMGYRGEELRKLLNGMLPPDDLTNRKQTESELDAFYTDLLELKIGDKNKINELASKAVGVAERVGKQPQGGIGGPQVGRKDDSPRLATHKDGLFEVILKSPSTAKALGYTASAKPGESSDGVLALRNDESALLKEAVATLKQITRSDVRFDKSSFDLFARPLEIGAEPPEKEADARRVWEASKPIAKKLDDLKAEWFRTTFMGGYFREYLKFPAVRHESGVETGSNEELTLLYNMCLQAKKPGWTPDGKMQDQVRNLAAVFRPFFGTDGKTPVDSLTARKCRIDVVPDGNGPKVATFWFNFQGAPESESKRSIDLMGEHKPVEGIPLDQPVEIRFKENSSSAQRKLADIKAWELLKHLKPESDTWEMYLNGDRVTFTVVSDGFKPSDLKDKWPSIADFPPKQP